MQPRNRSQSLDSLQRMVVDNPRGGGGGGGGDRSHHPHPNSASSPPWGGNGSAGADQNLVDILGEEALGTMHREMGELLETISADVDVPFGEFRQVTRTAASAFLQTPTAQMMGLLAKDATTLPAQGLLELSASLARTGSSGGTPNRHETALSAQVLQDVANRLDQVSVLKALVAQLFAFAFESGSPVEDTSPEKPRHYTETILRVPCYEKALFLEKRVNKLVAQRRSLEAAEHRNQLHNAARRRLVDTGINYQIKSVLRFFFGQWSGNVATITLQRRRLVEKILKIRAPSLDQLFKAWRDQCVHSKLVELERSQIEAKISISNMEEELKEVTAKERLLEDRVAALELEEAKLEAQIKETLKRIHEQRIEEMSRILRALGLYILMLGEQMQKMLDPVLRYIGRSPSLVKLAKLHASERDEERNRAEDELREEREADERRRVKVAGQKRKRMEAKVRDNQRAKVERQKTSDGEAARLRAEQEYKNAVEANEDRSFEKAEMVAAGERAKAEAIKEIEQSFKAWVKARDEDEAARLAQAKADQEHLAAKSEAAFNAVVEREDTIATFLDDARDANLRADMERCEKELPELRPDEMVLRWVKYHLQRSCRKGYPYRRKVTHFRDDLKDGVSFLQLLKRILPGSDFSALDDEVDPQVRLAAVTEAMGTLDSVGFTTQGHILGNDTFLNGAFLARLMGLHHGISYGHRYARALGEAHGGNVLGAGSANTQTDIYVALLARRNDVQALWATAAEHILDLTLWDRWHAKRNSVPSEGAVQEIRDGVVSCSKELVLLIKDVKRLFGDAKRANRVWSQVREKLDRFGWDLFACKVLQEEEAPLGSDIDPAEHAPMRLVDQKFDRKFEEYTRLQVGRFRDIMREACLQDAKKEAGLDKERRVREQCEVEKRVPKDRDLQLTQEEMEAVVARVEAEGLLSEEALDAACEEFMAVLKRYFPETSRVFKYYAAGEAGAADGMSAAEWWNVCNDSKFSKAANPREDISKPEFEEIFNATESPEEIQARALEREREQRAKERAMEDLEDDGLLDDLRESSGDSAAGREEGGEEQEGDGAATPGAGGGGVEDDDDAVRFDVDDGEREVGPGPFVEGLIRVALRKFDGDRGGLFIPYARRFERLMDEHMVPNACKSNTETFRGELSLDEVQAVFKKFKPQLLTVFLFYAQEHEPIPGQPKQEPSMDAAGYIKMLKDSKIVTRSGDLKHDFPETIARKVFNDVQVEEEGANSVEAGGGADELIYMEFLELWGAIACYKFPNPYWPLQVKIETLFTEQLVPGQAKFALKGRAAAAGVKGKGKGGKGKGGGGGRAK